MYQNPAIADALVRARVAELRRSAEARPRSRRVRRRPRVTEAAREATGWLLVEMGLQLAVPRAAVNRSAPREHG